MAGGLVHWGETSSSFVEESSFCFSARLVVVVFVCFFLVGGRLVASVLIFEVAY